MLNFAEQTGSGAVIVVWSFLILRRTMTYITTTYLALLTTLRTHYPLFLYSFIYYILYHLPIYEFSSSSTQIDNHPITQLRKIQQTSSCRVANKPINYVSIIVKNEK